MANCVVPLNVGHTGASTSDGPNINAGESQAVGAVRGRLRSGGNPVPATDRSANPGNQFNLQAGAGNAVIHAPGVANGGGAAVAEPPFENFVAALQAGAGVNANAVGAHNGGVAAQAAQVPIELNLAPALAPAVPPALAPALAQPYFDIDAGLSGPPLRRSEVGVFF